MRNGRILAALMLLTTLLSACDINTPGPGGTTSTGMDVPHTTTQPTTRPSDKPKPVLGEPHRFISDAFEYGIPGLEGLEYGIDRVQYLSDGRLYLSAGDSSIGDSKSFIYDPGTGELSALPDNLRVIKVLEDGSLFVRLITLQEHTDGDETFTTVDDSARALLDGESYELLKEFAVPEGAGTEFDVSPDGTRVAFTLADGLYVGDLDFGNAVKLADSSPSQDEMKSELIRYPQWLTNDRLRYRMVGWEWVVHWGEINADGTDGLVYGNTRNNMLYSIGGGSFLYMEEHGAELGLFKGETGEKQRIFSGLMEYEGFAYDPDGGWVSYLEHEFGSEIKTDWTARFTIRDVGTGRVLRQYTTTQAEPDRLHSASSSPDGSVLLFTDVNEDGERVLYRMEIAA